MILAFPSIATKAKMFEVIGGGLFAVTWAASAVFTGTVITDACILAGQGYIDGARSGQGYIDGARSGQAYQDGALQGEPYQDGAKRGQPYQDGALFGDSC